jgi:hypothetical protein
LKKDQYRRRIITPHQNFITILRKFQVPITQRHIHPEHTQEMNTNAQRRQKKRRRRSLRWLNLYSAVVSTLAVLLAVMHALQKM